MVVVIRVVVVVVGSGIGEGGEGRVGWRAICLGWWCWWWLMRAVLWEGQGWVAHTRQQRRQASQGSSFFCSAAAWLVGGHKGSLRALLESRQEGRQAGRQAGSSSSRWTTAAGTKQQQ